MMKMFIIIRAVLFGILVLALRFNLDGQLNSYDALTPIILCSAAVIEYKIKLLKVSHKK